MLRLLFVFVTIVLLSFTDGGSAAAKEGFFSRLNPMRWFRPPAREVTRDGHHELIRAKLQDRGIDPDAIDQRMARIEAARDKGMPDRQDRPHLEHSGDAAPAKTEHPDWDSDQLDARIARAIDLRNKTTGRADGFRAPTNDAINTRMPIRRDEVRHDEPRVVNEKLFVGPPIFTTDSPPSNRDTYRWNRGR